MTVVFWTLANLALVLALAQLATALRVRRFYRPIDSDAPAERPPVSLLVPLKGAAPELAARLRRIVACTRPGDQVLLALETTDDPAHAVADRIAREHTAGRVQVVLAGPAGDRLGKPHNLAAALPHAQHALLAFVDDDVELECAVLDEGARTAGVTGVGAAFALPYYAGRGPLGGALVAAYTNYAFAPSMGDLALRGSPRFLLGGCWVTTRAALDAAGGIEPHVHALADDASLGRALHAAGRRNRTLRRPVRLAHEPFDVAAGVQQLLKWLTLLRAEGLRLYLVAAVAWNPVALALAAAWVAIPAGVASAAAALVFGATLALRAAAVLVLNRSVYPALPRTRFLAATLAHETLLAPWLFLLAAFRRTLVWRGRRLRVGPGGTAVRG